MKKILAIVLVLMLALTVFVACNPNENDDPIALTMVAPEGAPALAISELMATNWGDITYTVVKLDPKNDPTALPKHFVGNGAHADIGLLPVNAASKLLASGDEYKMVGVVTNGNLFFLSKNDTQLTAQNAKELLKGKSVAVVNLADVPGVTTKATLTKLGLSYTTVESERTAENVFLKGIGGTEIASSLVAEENAVDYVIAPEPAVSTQLANNASFHKVGALHDLYGRYPQAVLVVKTQILQSHLETVKQIFDIIARSPEYIKANVAQAVGAVSSHLDKGVSSFTEQNTTSVVVDGCGIQLKCLTADVISYVNNYIADIISVESSSAKAIPDSFYFDINK